MKKLVVSLCFLCFGVSVWACNCDPIEDPAIARDSATHIFEGKVIFVNTNWMSGGMKYTFQVKRYWKSRVDTVMMINSEFASTGCGYAFEEGKSYLVYAKKKFSIKTDRCSATKAIEDAEADLAILGPSQRPSQSPLLPYMSWTLSILTILALGFMAFVVLRKRNRSTP